MKRKLTAAFIAIGLASGPTPADAQSISSPFTFLEHRQEAGVFTGFLNAETGRFGFGPAGGMVTGGRYAVTLSGPLSLEGVLGFMDGTRDVVNPAVVVGDQVVGEGDVLLTMVDARLRVSLVGDRSWHGFNPFLAFGGGVAFDIATAPAIEDTLDPADVFEMGTSFLGTVGVGSRYFLNDRIALRGEGLFSLWSIDTPPGFSDPARGFQNVEESEWMSGLSFSIGLLYRW